MARLPSFIGEQVTHAMRRNPEKLVRRSLLKSRLPSGKRWNQPQVPHSTALE
ncbi:hypothetical protein AAHZ94_10655 [Streptomyces sp. HSW2009]|uniref:hypothetical protein n=1 Tax=Streptomyces sp. HSW2009 TaxID=3142890 RepID=UPI0032EDB844